MGAIVLTIVFTIRSKASRRGCSGSITGVERRRKWSPDEKLAVVAESFADGRCVRGDTAARDQLFGWRAKLPTETAAAETLRFVGGQWHPRFSGGYDILARAWGFMLRPVLPLHKQGSTMGLSSNIHVMCRVHRRSRSSRWRGS